MLMEIGKYKIYSFLTSHFSLDGGAMFGVIPKIMWEKYHPADELNRIEMVTRTLLIINKEDNQIILIDTGNGDKWEDRILKRFAMRNINIETALEEQFNIKAEDITHVILTHFHFDHIGGNTKFKYGNSGDEIVPTFPNAKYICHKKHYEWALNPDDRDKASFMKENWEAIVENNLMEFVEYEDEGEYLPNLFLHSVSGHTPYQLLVRITDESETKTLLHGADLIPLASQLQIPWVMGYDLYPMKTVAEKKKMLSRAVDNEWFIFYEHDLDIEMSQVVRTERGFIKKK